MVLQKRYLYIDVVLFISVILALINCEEVHNTYKIQYANC